MKRKIFAIISFVGIIGFSNAQQLVNLATMPAGSQDAVRSIPGSTTNLLRLGHLQSGTWNGGWDKWSVLGIPMPSSNTGPNVWPNDQALYGLTINQSGDRSFMGSRFISNNRCDGVVAWGDDNWGNTGGNPDRLVFEFHDSNAGGTGSIRQAMTMMPDPSSTGVYVGIGVYSPTEQLHTTQGVRHQGLVLGNINNLVGIDASGKLWRAPMVNGFGNLCPAAQNPLPGDYQMPLGLNRYYFTGQGQIGGGFNRDAVGIGYNCGVNLPARLSVIEAQGTNLNIETYAAHFKNANTVNNTSFRVSGGVYGEAKGVQTGNTSTPPINIGGVFEAYGTQANIGVCGRITKSSFPNVANPYPTARYAIGGAFMSDTALTHPAGQGIINVGVYARATNGIVGNYAGLFDGDVQINGSGWISTAWTTSDRRFKKEIQKLDNINEKIQKLSGYTYDFKTEDFKERHFDEGKQFGLIAQELKEVFPELVKEDMNGFLAVNYQGMIPVLLEAVKTQYSLNESQNELLKNQQHQIEELKSIVKSLVIASSTNADNKTYSIELGDKNSIVLNQNTPNPFAESTVISYNIPSEFSKAQIIFTTNEGKIIKTVDINEKGEGRLNIFANDLSAGIYSYSLVVDGKTIETKKLIKQ